MATQKVITPLLGAGAVLQVVQTVKTDTFSTTSPAETAFVDVTGFSVTITPSATSSKILILWSRCGYDRFIVRRYR